ncbi:MAG: ABC transporter permease subunit [Pseudomonadota bacterium]
MTSITEQSQGGFRLDMLWTDARYRSSFLQIVAFLLLMLAVGWLVSNAIANLAALGKDFNFSFLGTTASYDINQKLISYSSTSLHWEAAVVGMLNTLLVAFMGCIACTVIGVIAGVLRLSKNWVVSKLMLVYIEAVRNVPLLVQILLWYSIFIESLPAPKQFRENVPEGERATLWFDMIAATNRGFYVPRPVFEAGSMVMLIVFVVSVLALFLFNGIRAKYQERSGNEIPNALHLFGQAFAIVFGLGVIWLLLPSFDQGAFGIIWKLVVGVAIGAGLGFALYSMSTLSVRVAILVLPLVIAYYVMGQPVSWLYPELKGFNFTSGEDASIHARNSLMALWLALSIYTGAFVAEIVRGGIQAIPKGQSEAAGALGLRPGRIMSLVILPQALRVIIPPQISQYLNLTKNSSLAIAVGYMDVTGTLGGITLNQTGREMECLLLLMAFYLTISLSISAVINWFNERIKLKER